MPEEPKRLPLRDNPPGQSLVLVTLALLALGVVMVHSAVASVARPGPWYARVDVRHTLFAVVAAVVLLAAWRFDYRRLLAGRRLPVLAAAVLAVAIVCSVLVYVPGVGHAKGGQYRWLRVGPREYSVGFQPSELLKVALVVFLSAWLARKGDGVRSFTRTFLPAVGLIALCTLLVVTQDFGTAVILCIAAAATLLIAGVPIASLLGLVPPAAAGFYLFVMQSEHRWLRIQAMLDPWDATNPSAYQPRQSLLAITSGGWTGKGVGNGALKLGFLPEDSTDFIFSVFCEEWGFVGAVLLMGLVVLWIWQARRIARRAPDRFAAILAASLGFLVALQAVMHIAVDVAAAPPTGMSMPFVSAGGTALVAMSAAAALIVSVSARTPSPAPAGDDATDELSHAAEPRAAGPASA